MNDVITIVILNYNGYKDTIECLTSLKSTISESKFDIRIIIVDNNSINESICKITDWATSFYPNNFKMTSTIEDTRNSKIVLFKNPENIGFSGGNNVGIRIADYNNSDFVILLNNDTVVVDGFVESMISQMQNKDVAMVGPKIYDYYNRNQYILGGRFIRSKCTGVHYYDTEEYDKQPVTFLSGCCWMIRMSAIKKCGLMDENYFLYVEDVDYCYRMVQSGYKLVATKDATIYHKEGRSTIIKPSLYYYNTRNRLFFCKVNNYKTIEKVLFYTYIILNRIYVVLKDRNTLKYIYRAFIDFNSNKFGQLK